MHCSLPLSVSGRKGKTFQVLLGAHSLSQPEPHKRLYAVRAAVRHPGSNIETNDDDLLLLQVSAAPLPSAHAGPVTPAGPRLCQPCPFASQNSWRRRQPSVST